MILGYFILNRQRFVPAAIIWLVLGSLFFYRYWNGAYLQIILFSILINFAFGTMLHRSRKQDFSLRRYRITHKSTLALGILFNIGFLGYYKYSDFFLENINVLAGTSFPLPNLALPLAISFFTFQQIAYLVDCSKENAQEYDFLKYCLFVSFFPQLIAGPIVHHREMMPQFSRLKNKIFNYRNAALGIFFFSMGLFKKICIADQFSVWAGMGFDSNTILTFFDAWGTSLSYTFQLYFDFSGYTDMAIGSALFFNILLPVNFNSPYKSGSIREFWRRWHITLSRWLRDYLYIPLGGNRKGWARTYINLLITFLLAGLWHGASWSFVLWGGLHGIALVLHRIWNRSGLKMPGAAGWLITFLFVNASWVIFRAATVTDGLRIFKGMIGLNGLSVNSTFVDLFRFSDTLQGYFEGLRAGAIYLPAEMHWYLAVFSIIVFVFPNSCQMGGLLKNSSEGIFKKYRCFQPTLFWAVLTGTFFSLALYRLLKVAPTEFLYFNF
jgi:D-alanyl-lipoteichoic acid acyltransferase DltB (MBOAT superfamily)